MTVMRIGAREARGWRGRTWDKTAVRAKGSEKAKEQNFGKLFKAEQARRVRRRVAIAASYIGGRAVQGPEGHGESSLINDNQALC